jgi:hypothetical protein
LYRNRLKAKLKPIARKVDTNRLQIKQAITEAAEESIGYKKPEELKMAPSWNDKIKLAKVTESIYKTSEVIGKNLFNHPEGQNRNAKARF